MRLGTFTSKNRVLYFKIFDDLASASAAVVDDEHGDHDDQHSEEDDAGSNLNIKMTSVGISDATVS